VQILDWPLLAPEQRVNTDSQLRALGYHPLSGTVDTNSAAIPDYEVAGSPNDTSGEGISSTGLAFGGAFSGPSSSSRTAKPSISPPWWVWLAGAVIAYLVFEGHHG
jgi:hypothetical protein